MASRSLSDGCIGTIQKASFTSIFPSNVPGPSSRTVLATLSTDMYDSEQRAFSMLFMQDDLGTVHCEYMLRPPLGGLMWRAYFWIWFSSLVGCS